jgi:hypothetical protein
LLEQFGMKASMSRRGNCYDNAPMESFWGTLKNELVHHRRYETRAQAIVEITEYIDIFYNRQRRHSRLGNLSPAAFTQQFYRQQQAGGLMLQLMVSTVDDLAHNKLLNAGGWELKFAAPRAADQLPALIHALPVR